MTKAQIETAQTRANIPFATAKSIRELLDFAREQYGKAEWDEADVETQIIELVTGEG